MNRKNNLLFVSYYTIDTPYEQAVPALQANMKRYGLAYIAKGYKTRGSWIENIRIKFEFVYEMMIKYPKCDIVYIDVDMEFKKFPQELFELDCDIAAWYKKRPAAGLTLVSFLIYFRNNPKILDFVERLRDRHRAIGKNAPRSPGRIYWCQTVLQNMLQEEPEIISHALSKDFVFIEPPSYQKEGVALSTEEQAQLDKATIVATQISRKYRTDKSLHCRKK